MQKIDGDELVVELGAGAEHGISRGKASRGLAAYLLSIFTAIVLLSFPVLLLHVRHGGSSPYHLLALVAIISAALRFPIAPRTLQAEERLAIVGFGIFTLTIFISLVDTGFSREAIRELDVLLRPMWAIPIVFFFIRVRPSEGLFWFGTTAGATAAGINSLWEWLGAERYGRVDGATSAITYGNTALLMGFVSLLAIPYIRNKFGRKYTFLPFVAFLLGLIASFLSGSRGGWIALPVLTALLAWGLWRQRYQRTVVAGVLSLIVTTALVFSVPQSGVKDRVDKAVAEVELYLQNPMMHGGTSVGQRFEMWRAAWHMFKQEPLLGGGIGRSYHRFLQEGVVAGEYHPEVARQTLPHNAVLAALSLRGLVGLAGLLTLWLMLAYVFQKAAREQDRRISALGIAGLVLITSYMVFGLTDSVMDYGPPLVFFSLNSALIVYLIAQARVIAERGSESSLAVV